MECMCANKWLTDSLELILSKSTTFNLTPDEDKFIGTSPSQNQWFQWHLKLVFQPTKQLCSITFHGALNDNANYIATVFSPESSLLVGEPAMVSIHNDLKCAIAVTNTAPFNIYLRRDAIIGLVETEDINNNNTPLSIENVKAIMDSIAPVKLSSENLSSVDI